MAVSGPLALAAVDLGASSGRVMLGRVGPDLLELTEVARFRNGGVRLPDGLYWDVLGLYLDILDGVRTAAREAAGAGGRLAGLAVDSWAVDYGLVGPHGELLANPRHYRDSRTETVIGDVHAKVDPARLYEITGLQFLPFNTLYQLAADRVRDERVHDGGVQALLIPDLLGYWLTGVRAAEETNASTTGLLDARTGDWSRELVEALGLPSGLLPHVVPAGRVLGEVSDDVRAELGAQHELLVTTVGSHDTASAVVGVPADTTRFGYISCGTWGLVGVELDAPVLTEESRRANFTNERGVDGTIRYLRNVMGLWLLSESLRTWSLRGRDLDLTDLLVAAAALPPGGPRIDPDDPMFLPPGDMPERIVRASREHRAAHPRARARGRRQVHPRQPCRRLRPGDPGRRTAVGARRRRRPHRRRRVAERAALPADRRRGGQAGPRRSGRGHCPRESARPGPHARRGAGGSHRPARPRPGRHPPAPLRAPRHGTAVRKSDSDRFSPVCCC